MADERPKLAWFGWFLVLEDFSDHWLWIRAQNSEFQNKSLIIRLIR